MPQRAVVCFLTALAVAASAGEAATPDGRLVFRRYLDVGKTTGALFVARPDGGSTRQVTHPRHGVNDVEPDWSRDGRMIAFQRQAPCGVRDGLNGTCDLVYTMTATGTRLRRLVPCGFRAGAVFPRSCVGVAHPGWSPDRSKLAFQYSLADARYRGSLRVNAGVWVVRADGTRAHQITQRRPGRAWDLGPQWSPDGKRIAFFRREFPGGSEAVYTVAIDGSGEQRVTPAALDAANPNWSPDGRWILFTGEASDGASNLYVIHPDGAGLTNLTEQGAGGFHYLSGSFSPSGRTIATARTPGTGPEGAADLVVMNADGSEIRAVTKTRLWESGVDWGR